MAEVGIKQDESATPVQIELIAQSVVAVAEAMKVLSRTRLTRWTLSTLIAAHTRLPRTHVDGVLLALESMDAWALKDKKGGA